MKLASIVLVLVLVATTGIAEAHHHCHEVSHVVGHRTCTRFAMWSGGPSLWYDLGAAALRFDADNARVDAIVGRVRSQMGFGRGIYFGSEIDVGSITSNPPLADVVARTTMTDPASGIVAQGKVIGGFHTGAGSLTLASDLAFGVRMASFAPALPIDTAILLEVRGKVDFWLTPFVTLGVGTGVNVLDHHDITVAMTVGFHLMPFDLTR